jgi:hypothetical protein
MKQVRLTVRWKILIGIMLHTMVFGLEHLPSAVMAGTVMAVSGWRFHLLYNAVALTGYFSIYAILVLDLLSFCWYYCGSFTDDPFFVAWRAFKLAHDNTDVDECLDFELSGSCRIGEGLLSTDGDVRISAHKPRSQDHSVSIKFRGYDMDSADFPTDQRHETLFPVLITNGVLFSPTPGLHSALTALESRQMVAVPDAENPACWDEEAEVLIAGLELEAGGPLEPEDLEIWANHYTERRKREAAMQAVEEAELGENERVPDFDVYRHLSPAVFNDLRRTNLSMFAKCDETLFPKYIENLKTYAVKSRLITAIPMSYQVVLQPWIRAAGDRLKEHLEKTFSIRNIKDEEITIRFTYASGMLGADLSFWMQRARDECREFGLVSAIFLGDDLTLVTPEGGIIVFYTNDYSHFDNSQKGPQTQAELRILEALGVPVGVTDMLYAIAQAPSRARKRTETQDATLWFRPGHPRRLTGGPNTSLSNTTNNMLATLRFIRNCYSPATWTEVGLTSKIQRHTDIMDVEFLKGVWYPYGQNEVEYRWGWLPSAVLKSGKMSRKLKNEHEIRTAAYAMAQSFGDTPDDLPILGPFKNALLRNSKYSDKAEEFRMYKIRPDVASARKLDRERVVEWIWRRYQINRFEIAEMESLLDSVDRLPYLVSSRGFAALTADYR